MEETEIKGNFENFGISIIYGTKLHVKIWTHVVVFSHGAKLIVKTC